MIHVTKAQQNDNVVPKTDKIQALLIIKLDVLDFFFISSVASLKLLNDALSSPFPIPV